MAIFAILRLILSFYSNTKGAYTSSISAVRENRSSSNHQIFLADTNIFFCNFPSSFRSKTATFRQEAVSVQETWKFESCDRVCGRSDDVRVEEMGQGIEKTEAANDDSHVCSLRSWFPLRSASRDVEARLVHFIFHIACPHHSLVFQDFCENRFERSDPPNFIAAVFVDLQEAIV